MRIWLFLLCLLCLISCTSSQKDSDFVKASETLQKEINEKIESIHYLHGKKLYTVLRRLVHIGEPAIPSLLTAMKSDDGLTRSSSAYVLGQIGFRHPKIYESLRDGTADSSPTVRYESGAALLSQVRLVDPHVSGPYPFCRPGTDLDCGQLTQRCPFRQSFRFNQPANTRRAVWMAFSRFWRRPRPTARGSSPK